MVSFTANHRCFGKDEQTIGLKVWTKESTNLQSFVEMQYLEGKAITPALLNSSHKINDNWIASELIIIDIDEGGMTLSDILSDDTIYTYAFAIIPSSSYSHDEPRYHAYFQLDSLITDINDYRDACAYVTDLVGFKVDASLNRPTQACYGTVFNRPSMLQHKKSLYDGLVYFNPNAATLSSSTIKDIVKGLKISYDAINFDNLNELAERHNSNGAVSRRAQKHLEQSPEVQERVTLEAIEYAFKGWGRENYDKWLSLCFAAKHGCNSRNVMQAIIDHPDIDWKPGERQQFSTWWFKQKNRTDGITVATLFFYARKNGWLRSTGIEIPDEVCHKFNAPDFGDYLLAREIPKRLIGVSGLGTGKSLSMLRVIKERNIKKAVFFAPSIKLCTNLSQVLTSKGIDNLLYIDTDGTKDREILEQADILVTTLQTFAIKLVSSGFDVSKFELAVIDESDELISSFSRAGLAGLGTRSHVNTNQAFWGFYALKRILESCKYVIALDGTATQITLKTMQAFSLQPVEVWKNEFIRSKAPVIMVKELYEARTLAIESIDDGKSVVYAADTKKECRKLYQYIVQSKILEEDEVILITSETSNDDKVQDFFQDVNANASKYKLIIYNSAMGSGVSIVDFMPDVTVQVCSYIQPRKNIQVLNRFRRQNKVFVYAINSEELYTSTASERITMLRLAVDYESQIKIDVKERTEIAQVIDEIAMLAVEDEINQRRSYYDFYTAQLHLDGRKVLEPTDFSLNTEATRAGYSAVNHLLAEEQDLVMSTWKSVPPLVRGEPIPSHLSSIDIARARVHAMVAKAIPHYMDLTEDDHFVAMTVYHHRHHIRTLERFVNLNIALAGTLKVFNDDKIGITSFKTYLTRMKLISLIGLVFDDSNSRRPLDENTPELLEKLKAEIKKVVFVYDMIAGRRRNHLDIIENKYENAEDELVAILRTLLRSIGLKIKRQKGRLGSDGQQQKELFITNSAQIVWFLNQRGYELDKIDFNLNVDGFFESVAEVSQTYNSLPNDEKREVINQLHEIKETFEYILDIGTTVLF